MVCWMSSLWPDMTGTRMHVGQFQGRAMKRRRMSLIAMAAAALVLGAAHAQPGALNVMDYGAAGDGVADDSGAIQNALNAAAAVRGGVVVLPPGDYALHQAVQVPEAVTLRGVTVNVATAGAEGSGSRLLGQADAGQVVLGQGAALEGVALFFPERPGAADYPPAIRCEGDRTVIRWVHVADAHTGVAYRAGTDGHQMRGATIRTRQAGITGFPGGRLEAVALHGAPDSAVGLELTGPHAVEVFDCSVAGYGEGVVLRDDARVLMANLTATSAGFALVGRLSSAAGRAAITNCSFQGRIATEAACAGSLTFTGCHLERAFGQIPLVTLEGAGAVTFKACTFSLWDTWPKTLPAIDVMPGEVGGAPVIVTSCVFDGNAADAVHVRLSTNVREAVVAANVMVGAVNIENHAPVSASIQVTNNAVRAVQSGVFP